MSQMTLNEQVLPDPHIASQFGKFEGLDSRLEFRDTFSNLADVSSCEVQFLYEKVHFQNFWEEQYWKTET